MMQNLTREQALALLETSIKLLRRWLLSSEIMEAPRRKDTVQFLAGFTLADPRPYSERWPNLKVWAELHGEENDRGRE